MKTFTRDSTIHLKFNFRDHDGVIVNPTSATLSLSFLPHGGTSGDVMTASYPLVQNGDDWIYDWDSSVALPCVIAVHAQTDGGPPTSSIDTEFRLKANRANRQLAGDYWLDWSAGYEP
jgi:hypothetical protein